MNPQTSLEILQQYWRYDAFRPLQADIIASVLNGKDTLALLPTGGGKSICFQVPTLAMEGVCIVVTPLIALMKDQVEQLKRRNIRAAAMHSGMNWHELDIALDNCIHGQTKFLYVSPERLKTTIFIERAKQMSVCLLAIDEAHCISQWGYDFRPSYLQIAEFRKLIPQTPLIALTASATEPVKEDIVRQLQLKNVATFQSSFARPNLSYSAFYEENKDGRLLKILQNVQGSAIVYVRNRRRTKEVADWLNRQQIRAEYYHAGLVNKQRSEKQDAWIRNRVRVMVATNAFGMGIDKPDVRVVVHLDLPDNLEAYYQEAGRAGRDGQKAYSVVLYTKKDLTDLQEAVAQKYPPLELVSRVYQALANFYKIPIGGGEFEAFDFDIQVFTGTFGLPTSQTHYALKLLESEGLIQLSEHYYSPSKIHITVDNKRLYEVQVKNPNYDGFIKLLLRMYGGEIFTQFVVISETAIGQKHYSSDAEVITILQNLQHLGILVYEKQRDKPQLTFITARYDANYLPINALELEQKKQKDIQQIEAVSNYVGHNRRCRMQLLQLYFGEQTDEGCGLCDNCLEKKKQTQNQTADLQKIKEHILKILRMSALRPNQIIASLGIKNEQAGADCLKQLLADELIVYDEAGFLRVHDTLTIK